MTHTHTHTHTHKQTHTHTHTHTLSLFNTKSCGNYKSVTHTHTHTHSLTLTPTQALLTQHTHTHTHTHTHNMADDTDRSLQWALTQGIEAFRKCEYVRATARGATGEEPGPTGTAQHWALKHAHRHTHTHTHTHSHIPRILHTNKLDTHSGEQSS